MVFDWKVKGLYKVPAQDAGEELDRIYQKHGKIDAADVVDESRPKDAVLHPCFEWRDPVAAELWRQQQARGICNCIVTVEERESKEPLVVRAVLHAQGAYYPTPIVIKEEDKYNDVLQDALRAFKAARDKYEILSDRAEIKLIFSAIDAALEGKEIA